MQYLRSYGLLPICFSSHGLMGIVMIKLRTEIAAGFGEKRMLKGEDFDFEHDAAVAHALVKAMEESAPFAGGSMYGPDALRWINERAAEILRDDFGIEDTENG